VIGVDTSVIDRAWIASRIPHQGSMCLLDGVESWDEQTIICLGSSHLNSENPLRAEDRLGIANAIEYAAQAVAVHCALLMEKNLAMEKNNIIEAPRSGYLTSVRDVRWHRPRFDDLTQGLRIQAQRISGNDINVLYSFEVSCDAQLLMSGRAGVVLNAVNVQSMSGKQDG
jgi:predicted hotdog family 3-hydroxylacyl-ACP dehydratase